MQPIEIKTKIEFKPYIKLQYWLFYRKPAILIFSFIALSILIFGLISFVNSETENLFTFSISFGFFGLVYLPFIVWRTSRKAYKTNKNLQERMTYIFDQDEMHVNGESFKSTVSLKSIYQLKESREWLLLYQSKNSFNIIPKSSMTEEQINKIKGLFIK